MSPQYGVNLARRTMCAVKHEIPEKLLQSASSPFPLMGTVTECFCYVAIPPYINLLKTCVHIHKHMYENTPTNLIYIFRQQGNLLHF
jgi:hypothetical protein